MSTIHADSNDKTMKVFDISNIGNYGDVKERPFDLVEQERDNKGVSSREFVGGYRDGGSDGFDERGNRY